MVYCTALYCAVCLSYCLSVLISSVSPVDETAYPVYKVVVIYNKLQIPSLLSSIPLHSPPPPLSSTPPLPPSIPLHAYLPTSPPSSPHRPQIPRYVPTRDPPEEVCGQDNQKSSQLYEDPAAHGALRETH